METLDTYRKKLLAPEMANVMGAQGWRRPVPGQVPTGVYYMVVGLCELTGEVLKGLGVYEPEAAWMRRNSDDGTPRRAPGTGWSFLATQSGLLFEDKEIYFYKPVPPQKRADVRFPWVTLAE